MCRTRKITPRMRQLPGLKCIAYARFPEVMVMWSKLYGLLFTTSKYSKSDIRLMLTAD
jgi:hypothetical protein